MNNKIKPWLTRTASISTASLCILCCIPQEGMCLAANASIMKEIVQDFVYQARNLNEDAFQEQLIALAQVIEKSEDPVADMYQFLHMLVDQMNTCYGLALTMLQLFQQIRDNLHLVQISDIEDADLLEGLESLEQYAEEYAKEPSGWKEHCLF